MDANQKPLIYLSIADPELRHRWAECLGMGGIGCLEPAAGQQPSGVDIVVSDAATADLATTVRQATRRKDDHPSADAPRQAIPPRDPGLIFVGPAPQAPGDADACLAADASSREIELTCRLVLEIVRLRRESRSKSESHNLLLQLALTDSLTGLGNRRAWRVALRRAWAQLDGGDENICLMILDFDRFKALNDSRGHAAGDEALQIAGQVLASSVRKNDFAARLGGDEFGVMWLGLSDDVAGQIVERVRARLSERLSAATDNLLTASAGYAVATGADLPDSDGLLARADAALQTAKRLGRGRTERGTQSVAAARQPGNLSLERGGVGSCNAHRRSACPFAQ